MNKKQCKKNINEKSIYFCQKHLNQKIKYDFKLNLPYLRKMIMINDKNLPEDMLWLKEIPYDTRQLVIKDFIAAYKSAISNYKAGHNNGFTMKYKRKKMSSQIFHINYRGLKIINNKINLFKRRKIGFLRMRKKMRKWINKNIKSIDNDSKIIKYNSGEYYLLLNVKNKTVKKEACCKSVSLDPGVRTFQTFYSPDGIAGKIGNNICNKKLYIIGKKIDKLQSKKIKENSKRRKNISKRQSILRTKIKNVVNDLHWKCAHFLCANFETIIMPKFETKKMTKKVNRNIKSKAVRNMLSLSHYKFLQRLKFKCNQYNRNLIICSEEYTSKTCGLCGYINENLKGNKIFNCEKCKTSIDRDLNGARNIMIKCCATKK